MGPPNAGPGAHAVGVGPEARWPLFFLSLFNPPDPHFIRLVGEGPGLHAVTRRHRFRDGRRRRRTEDVMRFMLPLMMNEMMCVNMRIFELYVQYHIVVT